MWGGPLCRQAWRFGRGLGPNAPNGNPFKHSFLSPLLILDDSPLWWVDFYPQMGYAL